MTRYISLLILFLIIYLDANSQKIDNDSALLGIKNKVTNFFIEQGLLDESASNDTGNYVFAYELLEKKMIGFNKNGIYRIGVLQSHSYQHILIKEGSAIKIFNLKEIDVLLKELLDYRIRHNIKSERMLMYFSNIIETYWSQYKS